MDTQQDGSTDLGQEDDAAAVESPEAVGPAPRGLYDLVVLGAASAGIRAARSAAVLGARVALVVRHPWEGARRSDGWIAAAVLRQAARCARLSAQPPADDHLRPQRQTSAAAAVLERMGLVRSQIARRGSAEELAQRGVEVHFGPAAFVGRRNLELLGQVVGFRRAIVAGSGREVAAAIEGTAQADCLTCGSLAGLSELPRRLAVIGGGPIQCQLAQSFARLGSEVHLIDSQAGILTEVGPQAASIVQAQLLRDRIRLHLDCDSLAVERTGNRQVVVIQRNQQKEKLFVDQVLLASSRASDFDALGLDSAGVRYTQKGITVNDRLQTANRRIFAAGEACGREFASPQVAEAMAEMCVQNALRRGRRRLSRLVIPKFVATDPEVAQLGLSPAEAARRQIEIDTQTVELAESDAAVLDDRSQGYVAVHLCRRTGRIAGAQIVAPEAGELAGPLSVLIAGGHSPAALEGVIACRTSRLELLKQIAGAYCRAPRASGWTRLAADWRRWRASLADRLGGSEGPRDRR